VRLARSRRSARSPHRRSSASGCRCSSRRPREIGSVQDPEPRHDRRQHRERRRRRRQPPGARRRGRRHRPSKRGRHAPLPFTSFYTGYAIGHAPRRADRRDRDFRPSRGGSGSAKVGTRAAQAISKIVMAAVRAPRPRIALGSVAPTVVRAYRPRRRWRRRVARRGPARMMADIAPIDDIRSTARYRRRVARTSSRPSGRKPRR